MRKSVIVGIGLIVVAPLSFAIWKLWGPSIMNKYDAPGELSSLHAFCIFCKKVHNRLKAVYEDEDVFVMHDDFPKATTHLLVLSKRHIKNTWHLKPTKSDLFLLQKMKTIGEKFISEQAPGAVTL